MKTNWNKYDYSNSVTGRIFLYLVYRGYKKLIRDREIKSILELGAGTGKSSMKIVEEQRKQNTFFERVVLVDSCPKSIDVMQGFDAIVLQEDVLHLDLNEQFDLVHSQGLIEHFQGEDLEKLIAVHCKHVRPGGYLILIYPSTNILYLLQRRILKRLGKWIFVDEVPISKVTLSDDFQQLRKKRVGFIEDGVIWRKVDEMRC